MRALGTVLLSALTMASASADMMIPSRPAPPPIDVVYGGYCPEQAAASPVTQSVVAVDVNYRDGTNSVCSGTLSLDQSLVITAAHCLMDVASVSVLFDANARRKQTAIGVDRFELHPDFRWNENVYEEVNDIAAIYLQEPAPAPFKPVKLAQSVPIGAQFQVLGYGMRDLKAEDSRGQLCVATMRAKERLTDNKIELMGDGAGECYGDSGAPFLLRQKDEYVLAAIVSGGNDACTVTVATTVPAYGAWMRAFIDVSSGEPSQ